MATVASIVFHNVPPQSADVIVTQPRTYIKSHSKQQSLYIHMSQVNPNLTFYTLSRGLTHTTIADTPETEASEIRTTPHHRMEFVGFMNSVSRMLGALDDLDGTNRPTRVRATEVEETVYSTHSPSAASYSFLSYDLNANENGVRHVATTYSSVDEIPAAPVQGFARHLSSSRNARGDVYSYPAGEGIPRPSGEAVPPYLLEKRIGGKNSDKGGSHLQQDVQGNLDTYPGGIPREAFPPRARGPYAPNLSGSRKDSAKRSSSAQEKSSDRRKRSQRELTPAERRILDKYAHAVRVRLARYAIPPAADAIPTNFKENLESTTAPRGLDVTYPADSLPTRPVSAPPFIPTVLHRPTHMKIEPGWKAAEMEYHHEEPTAIQSTRAIHSQPTPRVPTNRPPSPPGQHYNTTDETHAHYDVTQQHPNDGETTVMNTTPASRFAAQNLRRHQRSRGVSPDSRIPTPAVPDEHDAVLSFAGVFLRATGQTLVPARHSAPSAATHPTFANVRPLESAPFASERSAGRRLKQAVVDLGALVDTQLLTDTARPFVTVVRKGDTFRLSVMIRDAEAPPSSDRRIPTVFTPYGERDMQAYDVFTRKSAMAGLKPYGPHGPMRQSHDTLVDEGRGFRVALRFPKNKKLLVGLVWVDLETREGWRGFVET